MKTFNFDVTPFTGNKDWALSGTNNGLFDILYKGYSNHIPIKIRPDDIFNTVSSIWGKYIVLNAEKFREHFVQHEGKKELTYFSGGSYSDDRMEEFVEGLKDLVQKDQDGVNTNWLNGSFSTSKTSDNLIRSCALLASQQKYYEYSCTLCCGFSEIVLEGTEEDWGALLLGLYSMPTLGDDRLSQWKVSILGTVGEMPLGEEDFWQTAVTEKQYGSGGQSTKNGWILNFNPFNEKGEWLTELDDKDMLNLTNSFPVHIYDNGDDFDVQISAGPSMIEWNNDHLQVKNLVKIERV